LRRLIKAGRVTRRSRQSSCYQEKY